MASSTDAVRNFVYDAHIYNLTKGWNIVQQLSEKQLDSWERIFASYPVDAHRGDRNWSEEDEHHITAFLQACPLLGPSLAAQLVAEAATFVHRASVPPRQQVNHSRPESLAARMSRAYFREKAPQGSMFKQVFRQTARDTLKLKRKKAGRLVPFAEAVELPGFMA